MENTSESKRKSMFQIRRFMGLQTPSIIFNTRRGSVYQLTPSNQKGLDIQNILVGSSDFLHMQKTFQVLKEKNVPFKKFLGFDESQILFGSTTDLTYKRIQDGTSDFKQIKIAAHKGNILVDVEKIQNILDSMNPDVLISLTDNPGNSNEAGKGMLKRAVEKSSFYLAQTFSRYNKKRKDFQQKSINAGDMLKYKEPQIFAPIQGGTNLELRLKSIRDACTYNIAGYTIYGLTDGERMCDRQEVYKTIRQNVTQELQDIIFSSLNSQGSLLDVLHGIYNGIDLFQVEQPFSFADSFLVYDVSFKNIDLQVENLQQEISDENFIGIQDWDTIMFKRIQTISFDQNPAVNEDFNPISKDCTCFTCQTHTKAYLAHLVQCNQLNGPILCTIHNVHTYTQIIEQSKRAIKENRFRHFIKSFVEHNFI